METESFSHIPLRFGYRPSPAKGLSIGWLFLAPTSLDNISTIYEALLHIFKTSYPSAMTLHVTGGIFAKASQKLIPCAATEIPHPKTALGKALGIPPASYHRIPSSRQNIPRIFLCQASFPFGDNGRTRNIPIFACQAVAGITVVKCIGTCVAASS